MGEDYVENTNEYYNIATNAYLEHWDANIHFFRWNEDESRQEAIENTTDTFLDDGLVDQGSHVLDLGCGIGELSRDAADRGATVVGVNINAHQLDIAEQRSTDYDNVSYEQQDIMELDLAKSFDTAYLIGVDPHLPAKEDAVRRILNHLKPGGRLIITAWLKREGCTFAQKEFLLEPLYDKGGFAGFGTFAQYARIFEAHGCTVIRNEDWTDDIRPCVEDFYNRMFDFLEEYTSLTDLYPFLSSSLVTTLGKGEIREKLHDVFLGPVYLKLCLDADIFRFGYFVVEK